MTRLTHTLEAATNVAILLAALALIVVTYLQYFAPRPAVAVIPRYHEGEVVPALTDVTYKASARTIVLFIHSNCQFCTESMPFFLQLVRERDGASAPVQVVAASLQSDEGLRAYLADYGLVVDRAVSLSPEKWPKLSLTPTVIVVDQAGHIEKMWTGLMSPAAQVELVGLVKAFRPTTFWVARMIGSHA